MLQSAKVGKSVRLVGPLALGIVVVDRGMTSVCATLDPKLEEYLHVKQCIEVALSSEHCSNQSTRLDSVVRELKQTTTTTATRTSSNKRFNGQNNSCARAL